MELSCQPNGAVLPNEYQIVLSKMTQIASLHFPGSELALYGSVVSGFWHSASDIDVSLMTSTVHTRHDVIAALQLLSEAFVSIGLCCTRQLYTACVPIIKLEDASRGLSIDLSVNNGLAIQNSKLLQQYSGCDHRVHPLVMRIKEWAKTKGIADASTGSLSSYAYALMTIFYLLVVVPPVVPNLQDPTVVADCGTLQQHNDSSLTEVAFVRAAQHQWDDFSLNRMSVEELFFGFFDFYVNKFSWSGEMCSIKDGVRCSAPEGWVHSYIYIQDPFVTERNLGCTISATEIEHVWHQFDSQFQLLLQGIAVDPDDEFYIATLPAGQSLFDNGDGDESARATLEAANESIMARQAARDGLCLGTIGVATLGGNCNAPPPADGHVYHWEHRYTNVYLWEFAPWNHIVGAVKRDTKRWLRLLESKEFQTADEAIEDLDILLSAIIEKHVKKSKTKRSCGSWKKSNGYGAPSTEELADGSRAVTSNRNAAGLAEHFQLSDGSVVPLRRWKIRLKTVKKALLSIDVSKPASNSVDAFWKNTADAVAPTLTKLFQFIAKGGCYPTAWKQGLTLKRSDGALNPQSCSLVALENASLYFEATVTDQFEFRQSSKQLKG